MQNEPPRRRPRRRGRGGAARPVRPPAQPTPPPATRSMAKRAAPVRAPRRRPQRSPDELRAGTPCVVLVDCREGEPDRSGASASFEGFFDFETGEPRRQGYGIPRLIVRSGPAVTAPTEPHSAERVWGFEVWWRLDPTRAGLTDADREELEASKRLLRGLVRDARRRTPLAIR